jgi:hypothetical protein
MGTRRLHILGSLRSGLHTAQIDAIELACLDCSYEPIEHDDIAVALADIQNEPHAMVLLEPKTLIEMMTEHGFSPNGQTILCTLERENPLIAPYSSSLGSLRYVVGAATPSMMRGTLSSILEFQVTRKARGLLSRLLQVQCLQSEKKVLVDSAERGPIQDQVTDFFTRQIAEFKDQIVSGTSSYPKNMGDVLDEFLMNAIWDACPSREHADRSKSVILQQGETVSIETACDGTNLALSVSDSHGSFPKSAILKPLRYALGLRDDAKINEGPGGAGLGLYLVVQKVAALSYEVERGKMTRAVAVMRGDQSLRDMQKKPKTVLFFETETL